MEYRENYKGLHKPPATHDLHIATYNGDYFIGTWDELKSNGGRHIKNDDFIHELTAILIQRPVLDAATRYLQNHKPVTTDTEYARELITAAVKALGDTSDGGNETGGL
ncbi:MAG: hypothetical protein [Caudoviricetes sp.]|nr:MAG: hypothetical protein [Caudoviricetes sp.]